MERWTGGRVDGRTGTHGYCTTTWTSGRTPHGFHSSTGAFRLRPAWVQITDYGQITKRCMLAIVVLPPPPHNIIFVQENDSEYFTTKNVLRKLKGVLWTALLQWQRHADAVSWGMMTVSLPPDPNGIISESDEVIKFHTARSSELHRRLVQCH